MEINLKQKQFFQNIKIVMKKENGVCIRCGKGLKFTSWAAKGIVLVFNKLNKVELHFSRTNYMRLQQLWIGFVIGYIKICQRGQQIGALFGRIFLF